MATVADKSGNNPRVLDTSYATTAKRLKEISDNTAQTAENTTPTP